VTEQIIRHSARLDDDGNAVRGRNVTGCKGGETDAQRTLARRMSFIEIAVSKRRCLRREKDSK
jgi:hypothetical protein